MVIAYGKIKQDKISVSIAGEGRLTREFRSRGEAIHYLQKHYGPDYKKLRPKFNTVLNGSFFDVDQ